MAHPDRRRNRWTNSPRLLLGRAHGNRLINHFSDRTWRFPKSQGFRGLPHLLRRERSSDNPVTKRSAANPPKPQVALRGFPPGSSWGSPGSCRGSGDSALDGPPPRGGASKMQSLALNADPSSKVPVSARTSSVSAGNASRLRTSTTSDLLNFTNRSSVPSAPSS